MQLTTCSKPAVHNLQQVCSSQFAASLQFTTCSKSAVHNLQQVCSSQLAASLQFAICSKSAVHNLQQVCSSQFAPSLPFATCSKSAVRNLQQACWQLAADLLSSSRSKRCERILISAWWSQVAASLQQTCCNLRVSGCVFDKQVVSTICSTSENIKLQQVWFSQTWCNLMRSTDLLQVARTDLSRLVIHKLDASCFNNLQQVSKYQVAASLIFATCISIDAFNRLAASCSIRLVKTCYP